MNKIQFPILYLPIHPHISKGTAVLLGAQMLCPRATDMIGELATAVANGLTSRQLMYAMRAHPTFNEAIASAVEDSRGKSVTW